MKRLFLILLPGMALAASMPARAEEIRTVTCQSWDERTQYCPLPKKTRQVVLTRNISDKDCTRGRNWEVRKNKGYDELWVRRGCRGEFTVRYGY
jgi:hypothetical protein